MTCIKFFKKEIDLTEGQVSIIKKPKFCNKQVLNYIHDLNGLSSGKYDVLYGLKMDDLVEVQDNDELKSVLHDCTIDYVVIDHDSAEIKLVITKEQDQEKASFLNNVFTKFNINHIQLRKDSPYDLAEIRTALAA
ncbi:hypothetical protein [Shewanella sp. GXUN23E]|uniref:hypothetical protein n=1 Tax=Shewanella sp. GXUN23E TaxID=3422498 RepID=UPI003D7E6C57